MYTRLLFYTVGYRICYCWHQHGSFVDRLIALSHDQSMIDWLIDLLVLDNVVLAGVVLGGLRRSNVLHELGQHGDLLVDVLEALVHVVL